MNESQINENEVENKLEESVVDNCEENIVDNDSKIGMKIFASILLIIMFLSIVFGLLLSLDVFSDDCDGSININKINTDEVKAEYKEKGYNFCEDFTSSEDILDYIKSGKYDRLPIGIFTDDTYSESDMIALENYVIDRTGKNENFMYNTIFIIVDGLYTPLIHFTEDNIYFDIETFNKGKDSNIDRILNIWVDYMYDMGFSHMDITYLFDELDNLDKEISSHFLQINILTMEKPVIYLYPEKVTELNITLETENIDLTTTYPDYKDGWDVMVYPDGTIVDKNNRKYSYLYWEGNSKVPFIDMSKGFVVSKDNYIEFLECKLSEIGLTDKEACDFITYWLPQMNEYEYCLASFQMENYEDQVKLDYSVNPDNELRLFVAFKGLDGFIEIEEQDLSYYEDFEREGFVVVEWGGCFIDEE